MSQKALATWLKAIIIGMAVCGIVVFGFAVPYGENALLGEVAHMTGALVYIWVMAVPCYGVLVFAWRIADNIGKDNSFCKENAGCFKWIAIMAAIDTLLLFVGNVVLMCMDATSTIIVLCSFIICFVGIAISVAAAGMSHMVLKAAQLQEQNDLTI